MRQGRLNELNRKLQLVAFPSRALRAVLALSFALFTFVIFVVRNVDLVQLILRTRRVFSRFEGQFNNMWVHYVVE